MISLVHLISEFHSLIVLRYFDLYRILVVRKSNESHIHSNIVDFTVTISRCYLVATHHISALRIQLAFGSLRTVNVGKSKNDAKAARGRANREAKRRRKIRKRRKRRRRSRKRGRVTTVCGSALYLLIYGRAMTRILSLH